MYNQYQMNLQIPSYCQHFQYLKISQHIYKDKQCSCKYCFLGPTNLWLCLSKGCSTYVCTKNNFEHFRSHLQQSKKSKKFHSIFMNIGTTQIKCIQCNIQIGDLDIPFNQSTKKKQDPFIYRCKILPALNELVANKIVGQLQNPEGHRKISRGLVGLFPSKYNYSINAAIQFLSHCKFIRELILEVKPSLSNKVLCALKEVVSQLQNAQFRSVTSDVLSIRHSQTVSQLLYKQFPKLYGYKRKDPFEIILYFFNSINQQTQFYSLVSPSNEDVDEWDLFNKKNAIKPHYIVFDAIESALSLNYHCYKCNKSSAVSQKVQFLKLSIPKKRRKVKQIEKQLASHRCQSPVKNRKKSLLSVFKQDQMPITLVQLLIQLMKSPLHKDLSCEGCSEPLKKTKIHFSALPDILFIQIARISKDGSVIDETSVQLTTESLDLGPFTSNNNQEMWYDFESAICIQKDCLFPVLVIGQFNKQKYVIRNQIVQLCKEKLNPYLICYKRSASESSKQKLTQIRDDFKSQSLKKYILPDFWLLLLQNGIQRQLKNPFVCRHNCLKPNIQSKMMKLTKISQTVYQDLNHFYGFQKMNASFRKNITSKSRQQTPKKLSKGQLMSKLSIYDNQVCQICSKEIESLTLRRKKQKQYVLMFDKLKAQGLPFCMISGDWLKKWSKFLYNKESISYMPKGHPLPLSIENRILLDGNKCKPNLVKNQDYKVVNIYLWKFLKELYGGGPQIRYKWKQGRQNLDQEMIFEIKNKVSHLKSIFSHRYVQSPTKLITSLSFIENSSFVQEGSSSYFKPIRISEDFMEQQLQGRLQ